MSEEVIDVESKTEEIQHQMYVQQIDWETFTSLVEKVTNVNRVYMYNMPDKAEKYAGEIVDLIQTLDNYLSSDEDWRVTNESNVPFKYITNEDKICVGNWVISEPKVILCIPKLNSFFIIPSANSTYKGSPSPTHIIQLSNCISIMPMLLCMREIPDNEKEGVINIAMTYEMIPTKTNQKENPSE